MKNDAKNNSVEKNKTKQTSTNEIEQGGANSNFPKEYEEQRSSNIRMKPQPYNKEEKNKLKGKKNNQ